MLRDHVANQVTPLAGLDADLDQLGQALPDRVTRDTRTLRGHVVRKVTLILDTELRDRV